MPNRCQNLNATGAKAAPRRMRFTDLAISRLKPPAEGEVIYWDTILIGLGLRLSHTGRKTFIVAINGGKCKIGANADCTVAEARARARELMEVGVQRPAGGTFHTIVEEFLAHGRTRKGRELRANTVNQYRRAFARYCRPLHSRKFGEIRRRDISPLLRQIATESGAPTASLVRAMLARLWSYAIETDEDIVNVVSGTPSYAIDKGIRVLTDGEIAAIWLMTAPSQTTDGVAVPTSQTVIPSDYALILRMLLWTGARRSEVGGMRWSELSGGSWRVPPERTKNGRELVLPLPRQARDAVTSWNRVVGRDSMFGTWSDSGFSNWATAKRALDDQLGFNRPWTLHDLRRTVETRLAKLGVGREVRSRLLNHDIGPLQQTYDHYDYEAEKQSALQLWADELDRIVQEHKPQVIKMRRV